MLRGLAMTLKLFVWTLLLSLPAGLPFALFSVSRFWPLRVFSHVYIWAFRGTPLMLQLFFFYFGLGIMVNDLGKTDHWLAQLVVNSWLVKFILQSRFNIAVLTFAMNYAAYFAEIYRAGIQSIDSGQYEAAKTLGFTRTRTMFRIIIPQTISRIIPPVCNETITLVKDTALVYVISLPELMKAARDAANRDTNTTPYVLAAACYLGITLVLTQVYRKLEKRSSRHEREAV